jgi:hypothetical protein
VRPGGEVHAVSHVTTVAPFEMALLADKKQETPTGQGVGGTRQLALRVLILLDQVVW